MRGYELDDQQIPREHGVMGVVSPIIELMHSERMTRQVLFQRYVIGKTTYEPVHELPIRILPPEFYGKGEQ